MKEYVSPEIKIKPLKFGDIVCTSDLYEKKMKQRVIIDEGDQIDWYDEEN